MTGGHGSRLSVSEQCGILGISRSAFYGRKDKDDRIASDEETEKEQERRKTIVFEAWMGRSTYGYRKISYHLQRDEKCAWATERVVRRFYRELLIHGERPSFKTTKTGKKPYGKFPCLLRNRCLRYCNEAWATDITYIKTPEGMVYFTAVIDLFSRRRLSKTMEAGFCLDCVCEAVENCGIPAIFNTDCGSRYTSREVY